MTMLSSAEKRRARLAIRGFGLTSILFGLTWASFSWASLQRADVAAVCQYEQTTSAACKRTGIYAGVVFILLGLPALLAPSGWLNRNMRPPTGPHD